MFMMAFFIITKTWKNPKCSIHRLKDNLWYIYTTNAPRNKEETGMLIHTAAEVNIECIMLVEETILKRLFT